MEKVEIIKNFGEWIQQNLEVEDKIRVNVKVWKKGGCTATYQIKNAGEAEQ